MPMSAESISHVDPLGLTKTQVRRLVQGEPKTLVLRSARVTDAKHQTVCLRSYRVPDIALANP